MCYGITNVPKKHRDGTILPIGARASLALLNSEFADVPPEERGRLSRLVLASVPPSQRTRIKRWAESMTNARPVPDGYVELLVFLALCHATKKPNTVHVVVNQIAVNENAIGIILNPD